MALEIRCEKGVQNNGIGRFRKRKVLPTKSSVFAGKSDGGTHLSHSIRFTAPRCWN